MTVVPAGATELVVLCDEDGAAIGINAKSAVHTTDTPLHLAFSVYLFDGDGRLLVTRRAFTKSTFPGVRTNSCCGHPAPGESMADAITRRVRYELGVIPTKIELMLPAFRYRAVAADATVENELCPVYRAILAGSAVHPQPGEVVQAWWVPWAAFARDPDGRYPTDGDHRTGDDPHGDDTHGDPLSAWSREQVRELAALGPEPLDWPTADPLLLPAATRG